MNSTFCLLATYTLSGIARRCAGPMNGDDLVDGAAQRNLHLVMKLADRATIGPRVVAHYKKSSGISH